MFNLQKDSIRMSRIFYALSKTKRNFLHYWLQKIIKYPGFFSFPHTPLSFCFLPQIAQVRPFQNAVLHLFRVINWNYLRLSSNNHYKRKMSFWGPSGIMVTWKLSPPLMWVQKRESVQKLHVVLTWNDATEKNQYRSWLMMTDIENAKHIETLRRFERVLNFINNLWTITATDWHSSERSCNT